mmetsp:Transcript_23963/g.42853  ORF Transcript_23963/g.42853 Transcript_23963/m.42853 type:complete len:563 (-) Transcript_23963:66-1754(-)
MTRAQLGWHESRFARIEHLPSQVNQKAERMRSEMMRAQIPLVIDSPFLRRKGQAGLAPGMVALEAVCKHFGSMVHPESEWIESLQNRNFFENMVLANASTNNEVFQKLRNAEAKEKADHGNANERFQHFSKLSFRLQQPDRQAMTASISLADSAAHWGPSTAQSSQPQSKDGEGLASSSFKASLSPIDMGYVGPQVSLAPLPTPPQGRRPPGGFQRSSQQGPGDVGEKFEAPGSQRHPRSRSGSRSPRPASGVDTDAPVKLSTPSRAFRMSGALLTLGQKTLRESVMTEIRSGTDRSPSPSTLIPGGTQTGYCSRAMQLRAAGAGNASAEWATAAADSQSTWTDELNDGSRLTRDEFRDEQDAAPVAHKLLAAKRHRTRNASLPLVASLPPIEKGGHQQAVILVKDRSRRRRKVSAFKPDLGCLALDSGAHMNHGRSLLFEVSAAGHNASGSSRTTQGLLCVSTPRSLARYPQGRGGAEGIDNVVLQASGYGDQYASLQKKGSGPVSFDPTVDSVPAGAEQQQVIAEEWGDEGWAGEEDGWEDVEGVGTWADGEAEVVGAVT